MGNNVKNMIKHINDGKNLEMYIPGYAAGFMDSYYKCATLSLTMQYYTLYEVAGEETEVYEHAGEFLSLMNGTVKKLCFSSLSGEETEEIVGDLDRARQSIISKMQILTAYVDRLQIYEYILNRMELNFKEQLEPVDETAFIQKLTQYIFGSKDNVMINDRIREAIGQLPIRMSRTKYFELIRDSLSVYTGSDKSAADSYIYMLETCSMLYEPEGIENEFTQFKSMREEFETVCFEQLDEEAFAQLVDKVSKAAKELTALTDCYVNLQEIINNLYILALANPYAMVQEEPDIKVSKEIIDGIYTLFTAGSFQEVPEYLEEKLELLEGAQEREYESYHLYEAFLFELRGNYASLIDSLMLGKMFESLSRMQKLMSSSIFINLNEEENQETADAEYISQVTEHFLKRIAETFQKNQKVVNRAIIANTISKMPVFFNSSDEVTGYIINSLEQCRDSGEKNVCISILNGLMEEEQQYQNNLR